MGYPLATAGDEVIDTIERSSAVDRVADVLAVLSRPLTRPSRVKDVLSGTPSGHPLHPLLVTVPIGAWVSGTWLDIAGHPDAARSAIALGTAAALPTALAGLSDWTDTAGGERRVGAVHAVVNDVAVVLYGASWWARRRGRTGLGAALSGLGLVVVTAGGWLGGHLSYAAGVGVDTTAFSHLPTDWVDVGTLDDLPEGELHEADAAGVPVVLLRRGEQIFALADRCTHRGAPLHEGTVVADCVECPWHGSRFALDDGAVEQGPATRPAPTFTVRVSGGRVQVRREESRALRTNPVGV